MITIPGVILHLSTHIADTLLRILSALVINCFPELCIVTILLML